MRFIVSIATLFLVVAAVAQSAATLPESRGHGVYSALVKRRLDDAHADGLEAAVIQADRDTSAPICAKLGFAELCSMEVYAWSPETRPAS